RGDVGAVVDVLPQQPALAGGAAPGAPQPDRVGVQQERRGAALGRRLRGGEVGLAEGGGGRRRPGGAVVARGGQGCGRAVGGGGGDGQEQAAPGVSLARGDTRRRPRVRGGARLVAASFQLAGRERQVGNLPPRWPVLRWQPPRAGRRVTCWRRR